MRSGTKGKWLSKGFEIGWCKLRNLGISFLFLAEVEGCHRGTAVCSALSGIVIMFHSYDYFSSGVSFFKIPQSFRDLT